MARILVLNGPNLNLLGTREPHLYGSQTLAEIVAGLERLAASRGAVLLAVQSNAEHELIAAVQRAKTDGTDAIIVNAGAFTHSSIALMDAFQAVGHEVIELIRIDRRMHELVAAAADHDDRCDGAFGQILADDLLATPSTL